MSADGDIAARRSPLEQRDWFVALAVVFLAGVFAWLLLVPGTVGTFHDDAVYVTTAKALASGNGYTLASFPGDPPQTKYPILFPLLLSIIWKLAPEFPGNLLYMQLLSLLCGSLTLAATYLYLVRFGYCSRPTAIFAVALCCVIPGYCFFSGQILSEAPFALSCVVALWALDKHLQAGQTPKHSQITLAVALAVPAMLRAIGVMLPVTAALVLLTHGKRWRTFALVASLLIIVTWIMPTRPFAWWQQPISSSSGDAVLRYQTDYLSWWQRFGWQNETTIVRQNLEALISTTGSLLSGAESCDSHHSRGGSNMPFVVGLLALAGLRGISKRGALFACVLGYLAAVCLWPWPPYRFLVPVLPLLSAGLFSSAKFLFDHAGTQISFRCQATLFAILVVTNASAFASLWQCHRQSRLPLLCTPKTAITRDSFDDLFAWVRTNTERDAVIASTFDSMTYLYTGRRAFRCAEVNPLVTYFGQRGRPVGTASEMLDRMRRYGADYVVLTPQSGFGEESAFYRLVEELQSTNPGALSEVYTGCDRRFSVLKVAALAGGAEGQKALSAPADFKMCSLVQQKTAILLHDNAAKNLP